MLLVHYQNQAIANQFNTILMKKIILLLALIVLFTAPVFAQTVKVAVAANLQAVIKELQAGFKNKTGIVIEPIVGSATMFSWIGFRI